MNIRDIHRKISLLTATTKNKHVLTNVDDDDCAVVKINQEILVITTDFINSSPAILELGKGSWYSLGQLVACHNLADLAGSGCMARFFLSGICAPFDTSPKDFLDFTQGVCDICSKYECALIGGDTKFGQTRSIYGTVIGTPYGKGGPFLRTQAKPGYKIIVSGPIGSFSAAVICLNMGQKFFSEKEIETAQKILFRTEVPFFLAKKIASFGYSCSGTDISDGLGTDILDICRSSGVSALIQETSIPVDNFTKLVADKLNVPPWSFCFTSGGDFSCVFGVPPDIADFCVDAGGILIGEFEVGPGILISNEKNNQFPSVGHIANRTQSFSDEILSNLYKIRDFYVNKAR